MWYQACDLEWHIIRWDKSMNFKYVLAWNINDQVRVIMFWMSNINLNVIYVERNRMLIALEWLCIYKKYLSHSLDEHIDVIYKNSMDFSFELQWVLWFVSRIISVNSVCLLCLIHGITRKKCLQNW